MNPPRCLGAALDYLALGWSPIPLCPPDHSGVAGQHEDRCTSPGKAPLFPWQQYQERRATADELRLLWNRNKAANVGIALGPVSGLIGIDVDSADGEAMLATHCDGPVPKTLEFTTAGGGRRLLFRHPAGPVQIRSFKGPDGSEALRILGKGAQTVAPPSIGANGRAYTWVPGRAPGQVAPADCPPGLLAVPAPTPAPASVNRNDVGAPSDIVARARAYLRACPPAVSGQGGHNHTLKVCDKLVVGFGLDDGTALALLLDEWNPGCQPPWSQKELRHKLADARKTARKPAGYLDAPAPRPAAATPANARPEAFTAADLMRMELLPPRWAVDRLVPEGVTIIAGRPKIGKSWLVLNLAIAVASGGVALGRIRVQRGETLYLALEDGRRRLQSRLGKLLRAQSCSVPPGLSFSTLWPRTNNGGLDALADWLKAHPDTRLIVIDTLARIRQQHRHDAGNLYTEDYEAITGLQSLALASNVAILIVHHTRKSPAEDPLDDVSGTLGLTGAADVVIVLKRPRRQPHGRLFITGRDVEEDELPLAFAEEYCLWTIAEADASGPDAYLPDDQRAIRRLLGQTPGPLMTGEIVAALRQPYDAVSKRLERMAKDGLIHRAGKGRYMSNPSNPSDDDAAANREAD